MRELLARIANFLVRFKIKIVHIETWDSLVAESDLQRRFNCIYAASILLNRNPQDFLPLGMSSQSQLSQDVVALMVANRKKNGYFVEFGASNGKDLSNTYLLEKEYEWDGLLCEPNPAFTERLKATRDAEIMTRAVYSKSDLQMNFSLSGELSSLTDYSTADQFSHIRIRSPKISVSTISLLDALLEAKAPKFIDYLSVDTEGSELEVLSAFDWSSFRFGFITVEHNFTPNEEKLEILLKTAGYSRILHAHSRFDAWFIPDDTLPNSFWSQ